MAAAEKFYNFGRFSTRGSEAPQVAPRTGTPNVVRLPQQELEKSSRRRVKPLRALARIAGVLLVCLVLGNIVYGQVRLTELTDDINTATLALEEARSIELQLQYNASQSMSSDEIETYAVGRLGMQKIAPGQITYIDAGTGEGGTVVRDADARPWFLRLWDSLLELLS